MSTEIEKAPGHRWQHPTHLEKVRRNEEAKKNGTYNPRNADDHPNPVKAPAEGFTLEKPKP